MVKPLKKLILGDFRDGMPKLCQKIFMLYSRGGVENKKLKAKDSKKFEAKDKDKPSRGQSRGPRTQTQVFSKIKKNFEKKFLGDLKKKVFKNFFSGDLYLRRPKKRSLQIFRNVSGVFQRNFCGSKIALFSSRGQGNFRGLEASRLRPRTSKCVLEDFTSVISLLISKKLPP